MEWSIVRRTAPALPEWDKRSSLFLPNISDNEKKFYNGDSMGLYCKTFYTSNVLLLRNKLVSLFFNYTLD